MNARRRVLLIDDHPLLRRGVAELLEATEDFCVVGSTSSAEEGLALAAELAPELILLDLHMPGVGGLGLLAELKRQAVSGRVVVLTASAARQDLLAALQAGADGYLLKDSHPDALLAALAECAAGQLVLDPTLAAVLASGLREPGGLQALAAPAELTERERQTLALIAEGLNNKLIARRLGISDGTVKIHVKHLLSKLNLHSRLELAAWAHRSGQFAAPRPEEIP